MEILLSKESPIIRQQTQQSTDIGVRKRFNMNSPLIQQLKILAKEAIQKHEWQMEQQQKNYIMKYENDQYNIIKKVINASCYIPQNTFDYLTRKLFIQFYNKLNDKLCNCSDQDIQELIKTVYEQFNQQQGNKEGVEDSDELDVNVVD